MVAFVMNHNLFIVMTSCMDDDNDHNDDDDNTTNNVPTKNNNNNTFSNNDEDDDPRIDPLFRIPKNHSIDIPYYYPVQITFTFKEDILEEEATITKTKIEKDNLLSAGGHETVLSLWNIIIIISSL